MSAVEYLRRLQAKIGLREPPSFEKVEKARIKQGIYSRGMKKPSTWEEFDRRYKSFFMTPFLETLGDEVIKCLQDLYVGFLPTHDPNAWTIQVPGDGPLVVLDPELLGLISYYNELQGLIAKVSEENTKVAEDLMNRGYQTILTWVRGNGGVDAVLPYELTEYEMTAVLVKSLSQEMLIIAHELAHVYLGHLDTLNSEFVFLRDSRVVVQRFNRSQQQELDADVQAVKWLINTGSADRKNTILAFASQAIGAVIEVFVLFHFIELNLGIPSATSSHPSSLIRLKHISRKCRHLFSEQETSFVDKIVSSVTSRLKEVNSKKSSL